MGETSTILHINKLYLGLTVCQGHWVKGLLKATVPLSSGSPAGGRSSSEQNMLEDRIGKALEEDVG